jgi:hypothetical protein
MTPLAGFIIAVIAAYLTRSGRRAAAVLLVPFLVITAVQTQGIAAGHGHSPPSTVWPLGPAISYYVVQLLILALSLGVAVPLGTIRGRKAGYSDPAAARRGTVAAMLITCGLAAAFVVAAVLIEKPVTHHLASGSPPWYGLLGILLLVVSAIVLTVGALRGRRTARRAAHTRQAPAQQARAPQATLQQAAGEPAGHAAAEAALPPA